MDAKEHKCTECDEKASMACRCSNPPTILCRNHVLTHMDKIPTDPHLMIQITPGMVFDKVLDSVAEDQRVMYVSSARRKFNDLKPQAKTYIEKRLETLASMREQFIEQCDVEQQFLNGQLEQLITDIEEEEQILQEPPQYEELVAKYGPELQKIRVKYEPDTWYTGLMKAAQGVFGKRDVLKLQLTGKFNHVSTLVWVNPGSKELRTWNADSQQRGSYTIDALPMYNWFNAGVIYIEAETVLIAGGDIRADKGQGKDCYTVNVETREFSKKADLLFRRVGPALCTREGKVYAFGDYPTPTTTAEEFDISENRWVQLPDSPQLSSCACTLHADNVFIGAFKSSDVVIYNITARTYTTLAVELPWLDDKAMFTRDDSVFIINFNCIVELDSSGQVVSSTPSQACPGEKQSTLTFIAGDVVYFSTCHGEIYSFNFAEKTGPTSRNHLRS